ncbi:MAG TPA: nitroreductase [Rhodobacteraceae bacterium]|jgi:nitroreductase|nr:nitroreductase [Paracoccaceae bacterium]HBV55348.1 nitroreductase [Paracoccaceae bacterium]
MAEQNDAVMEFLLTRRSPPAKTLSLPAPSRTELVPILTAGLRVPDHGKLEPWRLIVLERAGLDRLADLTQERARSLGYDDEKTEKGRGQFTRSPLCVAVVETRRSIEKVHALEQTYSAGAVCLSLVNAALASGWGASWITGWPAHDAELAASALGLGPDERVAGFIHIGTPSAAPPERPRPDLGVSVTWAG